MRRNVNIRTMEFDNAGLSVCVPESLWRFKGLLTATRCKHRPEMAKIRMHQTSEGKYSQSSPQCRMEKWRVGHDGHRWMYMPAQGAIPMMVITDCIHTLQLDSMRYPQGTLLCTIQPVQNPPWMSHSGSHARLQTKDPKHHSVILQVEHHSFPTESHFVCYCLFNLSVVMLIVSA